MFKRLLAFCCLLAMTSGARAQTLTYGDLVKRLYDLEALAVLPPAGEKNALASSYDRASRYDEATGKYVRWDANGDGGGIIRTEGEMQVLAEMTGPGYINRIWSATTGNGRVKIYLDGAEQPAVDLPFTEYFSGKEAPFNYAGLVYKTEANGYNNFVPISYQKSCKIVAEKGWGNYYQFTYTTFAPGTVVPTFSRDLNEADKAALSGANSQMDVIGGDPAGPRAGQSEKRVELELAAGAAQSITLDGPRAITKIALALPNPPADIESALRNVALRIRWDGETKPSVAVPLGDFFGAAPGAPNFKSLPSGMGQGGAYSYWYMPFARGAKIEIANEGKEAVRLNLSFTHAPLPRPIETLGRFHAKWHRDALLPAEAERKIDWTLLKTQGRGRFVGLSLNVWNPTRKWWGEGDEKFFVDGEKFPSTIGTGSEDYFGYAWSSFKTFVRPLHGQPRSDGRIISNYRWHIADNVPFQTQFEGTIEKYFRDPTRYAATVYWYLDSNGTDPYELAPAAERTGYYELPPNTQFPGAIEGEGLKVLETGGGKTQEQGLEGFGDGWSGNSQIWWTGAKPGDKLTLALPVATAGKYELKAQFTKAKDYAIAQLYLDGQKIGTPLDFYNDTVVPGGTLSLGTFDLAGGEHKFTIEITGANDKALKAYMVGLDFLKLDAVK